MLSSGPFPSSAAVSGASFASATSETSASLACVTAASSSASSVPSPSGMDSGAAAVEGAASPEDSALSVPLLSPMETSGSYSQITAGSTKAISRGFLTN